jgi:hypothetical protein
MNNRTIHAFNTLCLLAIFSLFAVCSLFVVLFGANVYHKVVAGAESNSEVRTSLCYVSNKVRTVDAQDVAVQTIDGQQVLVLRQNYDGETYNTYIYHYRGALYELFTKADNHFAAGNGDQITPLSGFSVLKNGSTLTLTATGANQQAAAVELFLT